MQDIVYNPEAVSALRSPDDLEKAISVIHIRAWLILAACITLLLGLLAWGVFGSADAGIRAEGIVRDGAILCLLDAGKAGNVSVGEYAEINGEPASVRSIAGLPVSRGEALEQLGSEYLADVNLTGNWGVFVTIRPENEKEFPESSLVKVHIITERVAPVSLILGDPDK